MPKTGNPSPYTDEQIRAFAEKHPDVTKRGLQEHFKIGHARVSRVLAGVTKSVPDVPDYVKRQEKRDAAKLRRELDAAHRESDELRAAHEFLQSIGEPEPLRIERAKHTGGEATAVIVASDWHCEERATLGQTGGRNEYNPAIAEKRAAAFFRNALKLVETQRHSVKIDNLVCALLGDFITGYIHEEFESQNFLKPEDATLFAMELIAGGLDFLLAHGGFKKIVVPCTVGNHGRTTKKMHAGDGVTRSYEYLMFRMLAARYAKEPRVVFQLTESYFNVLDIYGTRIRFHHGDAIGYGGGAGGVTIPLNKFIWRSQSATPAHYDVLGHFHQYTPSPKFLINGSLIGYNPYAVRIGAEYESPRQAMFLVDAKRGITIHAPILLDQ